MLDAERLGLQVETAINPAPLEGDPGQIERLVANLVDNAVAHNVAGGHIQISTNTRDRKAVLSVTNTGPIVSPGEIDRLFQPFQRLDPRRTRHTNGHGLGLSIVRAIAAAHHATVTADAQPGGGLAVTVAFPQLDSLATDTNRTSRTRRFAAGQTRPIPTQAVSRAKSKRGAVVERSG